jgi:hypothetical protein
MFKDDSESVIAGRYCSEKLINLDGDVSRYQEQLELCWRIDRSESPLCFCLYIYISTVTPGSDLRNE